MEAIRNKMRINDRTLEQINSLNYLEYNIIYKDKSI
jgi:hypothetical protein